MFGNQTVRDLGLLTLLKAAAIAAIYYACFAAYDGKPVDTMAHLLGPAHTPTLTHTSRGS